GQRPRRHRQQSWKRDDDHANDAAAGCLAEWSRQKPRSIRANLLKIPLKITARNGVRKYRMESRLQPAECYFTHTPFELAQSSHALQPAEAGTPCDVPFA